MNYWLMKSEPTTFSIQDLEKKPHQTDFWDGVRNYQVRNLMRDQMKVGDLGFFYHSSCEVPGIVGIVKITQAATVDKTAFDPKSHYFDPKSSREHPRWLGVTVTLQEKFPSIISLSALRACPELADFQLLKRGNRLSILPVSPEIWGFILKLR